MDGDLAAWWIIRDGQKVGPYTRTDLKSQADTGALGATDKVWKAGLAAPIVAASVHGLLPNGGHADADSPHHWHTLSADHPTEPPDSSIPVATLAATLPPNPSSSRPIGGLAEGLILLATLLLLAAIMAGVVNADEGSLTSADLHEIAHALLVAGAPAMALMLLAIRAKQRLQAASPAQAGRIGTGDGVAEPNLLPVRAGLGFLALFAFVSGWNIYRVAEAQQHWLPDSAVITYGRTNFHWGHKGNPDTYTPVWDFRFTVDNAQYEDSSDAKQEGYQSENAAWQRLMSRPNGSTVTIWYDPENPQRATIDRRRAELPKTQTFFFVVLLLALIVFG